jgi:hypothetical protein
MGKMKLLERLRRFLDADQTSQRQELESILKVTKKLKTKSKELRIAMDELPPGEERDEISAKLEVIEAQRAKAVKLIKELRGGQSDAKT